VVSVDADGRTHVDTTSRIVGVSAASGALWGAIFGILFLLPGGANVLSRQPRAVGRSQDGRARDQVYGPWFRALLRVYGGTRPRPQRIVSAVKIHTRSGERTAIQFPCAPRPALSTRT
jgi:hypothetical protein